MSTSCTICVSGNVCNVAVLLLLACFCIKEGWRPCGFMLAVWAWALWVEATGLAALQVKYWTESGASGFRVYLYQMRRRPGQGELASKALVFGGGSAPKQHDAASRRKEASPAWLFQAACPALNLGAGERTG